MDNVNAAVGNVTSWLRRAVAGGSDEASGSSNSTPATHHAPPAMAHQHLAQQQQRTEQQMREEEQRQLEEALRRSLQEQQQEPSYHQQQAPRQHQQAPRHQQAVGRGGDEEEEERALQLALEISRREAEEASQATRMPSEEAAAAQQEALRRHWSAAAAADTDLLRRVGLTGAGRDGVGVGGAGRGQVGVGGAAGARGREGVGAGNEGGGAVDTSNDEAIARLLQQELNLDEGNQSRPSAPPQPPRGTGSNNNGPTDTGYGSRSGGAVAAAGSGAAGGGSREAGRPAFGGVLSSLLPPVCAGCSQPLGFTPALSSMGSLWHPLCFKCHSCNQPITEKQFNIKEGRPYHPTCHRNLFHPKCAACQDFIRPNPDGMINFRTHPFWGDRWCPEHMADGTPSCTSCSRKQSRNSPPFIDLPDGRHLCLDCVDSAVLDSTDCRPLFAAVNAFFAQLGMAVRQQIPVLAVEQQALNDAQRAEREGHEHVSLTRGLCLSEEQTIQMVVRLPGMHASKSPFSAMGQQQTTVSRHCAVTAILVLYGLPRVLTASILAHELMHAWFKLDGGFRQLPSELEEGMCQVMAYLWLQTQAQPQAQPQTKPQTKPQAQGHPPGGTDPHGSFQQRFVAFCLHSIATDASPVYGDGFRAAHAAVLKHGLLATINHIRAHRTLPRV